MPVQPRMIAPAPATSAGARGLDQAGTRRVRLQQRLHRDVQRDLGGQPRLQAHRPQRGEMARLGGVDDGDHAEPLGARHGGGHRAAEHAEHRPCGVTARTASMPGSEAQAIT